MNYRTGKILLITSLLLLPAAWSPAWGEEPAFFVYPYSSGRVIGDQGGKPGGGKDFFQNYHPFRYFSGPAFCAVGRRHGVSLSGKE
jgi:hypothetical protein